MIKTKNKSKGKSIKKGGNSSAPYLFKENHSVNALNKRYGTGAKIPNKLRVMTNKKI